MFACFAGLRLSDVERLQWDQINLINGDPFIQFKQRKTSQYENLPLSDQAIKILQEVKKLHPVYSPEGDKKVFILSSRQRIQQVPYSWGLRARLPFKLTFHVSRHTFATMSLSAGVDLYTVGKLLGHREIRTTQVYARVIDESKLRAAKSLPVLESNGSDSSLGSGEEVIVESPVDEDDVIVNNLVARGEKIGEALGLKKDRQGRFVMDGERVSAGELALRLREIA